MVSLDIDECLTSSPCDDNAACLNTDGSYDCFCAPGFEGDGQICTGNLRKYCSLLLHEKDNPKARLFKGEKAVGELEGHFRP